LGHRGHRSHAKMGRCHDLHNHDNSTFAVADPQFISSAIAKKWRDYAMLRSFTALSLLLTLPAVAAAGCYGTDAYRTCYDYESGNSYSVTKFGDQTHVRGYTGRTGSSWSQSSQSIGNSTYIRGRAADGSAWNETINTYGGMTTYSGRDSDGNAFRKTC